MAFCKGNQVTLKGLNTQILNGAEGRVTGPADEATGRFPVKLLRPQEAVAAYPDGVKLKPVNIELLPPAPQPAIPDVHHKVTKACKHRDKHRDDPGPSGSGSGPQAAYGAMQRQRQSSASTQGNGGAGEMGGSGIMAGMNSDPASWAKGLSPSKQYEWFVDCYRMRVDDDYAYGGGDVHGLYDPEHDGDSITADFLHFCKLAVLAHVVPQPWDWKACLEKAKKLLGFAFEKSDAQEKYGSENVFSVLMGGRSLRATAEQVYGRSCMNGADYDDESVEEQLREMIARESLLALTNLHPELFEEVGGVLPWRQLCKALQHVQ